MLLSTLLLGAIFWTAVIANLIELSRSKGETGMEDYCRIECMGFSDSLTSGRDSDVASHIITYGGNAHV